MKTQVLVKDTKTNKNAMVTLEVEKAGVLVGRKSREFKVEDNFCSSKHALIYTNEQGELWIKDLGSRNGIFVNDKKVTEVRLFVGTKVRIGQTVIYISAIENTQAKVKNPEVVQGWPASFDYMSTESQSSFDLFRAMLKQ